MKTERAQQSKYFTPDSLKYNWDDIYLSIDIRYIFFSKCMKEKIHFKRILGLVIVEKLWVPRRYRVSMCHWSFYTGSA